MILFVTNLVRVDGVYGVCVRIANFRTIFHDIYLCPNFVDLITEMNYLH